MKLLSYTVVVRYQAIILDFRLTLSLLENQLVHVHVAQFCYISTLEIDKYRL